MLTFRPILPEDDAAVAAIIRRVMPEFGADGPGFAMRDPEVDHMSRAYSAPGATYFVVVDETGRVVGGAGVAALEGGEPDVCELRKMYFLPEARGKGMGEALLRHCLTVAQNLGYRVCYLETLPGVPQYFVFFVSVIESPLVQEENANGPEPIGSVAIGALAGSTIMPAVEVME